MADRPLPSPFCSVLANRQNRHAPFERIRDCLPFGERFSHLGYRRTGWVYVYGVETTWRVLAGGAFTGTSEEIPSDVPRVGSPLRGDPLPIQPDPLRSESGTACPSASASPTLAIVGPVGSTYMA